MHSRLQFLLLLLGLTVLPGCWDRTEIDDLGIAIAASVDLTPDNKVLFSEQVYIPSPLGMGGSEGIAGDSGGTHYHVFSGVGDDIRAAHKDLQKQMSRRLFIADRNLYLISDKVAQIGIQPYIDELVRNPESRMRTHVVITKGDAVDYLKVQYPFEQTPGAALRKLVFGSASNYQLDLNGLMRMMEKEGQNASVPLIDTTPTSPQAKESFRIAGYAVLKKGKMVGEIPYDIAKGIVWLKKQMKYDVTTSSVPGHTGRVTTVLLNVDYDMETSISKGHPSMHIKVRCENDLIENNSDVDLNNPNSMDLLENVFAAKIKRQIEMAIEMMQKKYDADIALFSEEFHRAHPKEWKTLQKNWDEEFAKMPITVEVEDRIRRIGMTNRSLSSVPKRSSH